jgi:hypothetical protein
MTKTKLIAFTAAIALVGALSGCATDGGGNTAPYAGPHNHMRDAKQGAAPSAVPAQTPVARKSLRPAS